MQYIAKLIQKYIHTHMHMHTHYTYTAVLKLAVKVPVKYKQLDMCTGINTTHIMLEGGSRCYTQGDTTYILVHINTVQGMDFWQVEQG